MGPGRRADDTLLQVADDSDAEPVDLGVRNVSGPRDDTKPQDVGQRAPDAETSGEDLDVPSDGNWLSGLVRAEVLGVSGAALLLLITIGLPFMATLEILPLYGPMVEAGAVWAFAPSLVTAAVAAALGLGGLRQAAYHEAALWARITSGVAAVVGALVATGAALAWFAATRSELFEQFGRM